MSTPIERMEALQKRNQDLLADMKRLEKDYNKSKRRAEQLQKERDAQRIELSKTTSVKDKLEKLAREFTKDNKKLKVRSWCWQRHGIASDRRRHYVGGFQASRG